MKLGKGESNDFICPFCGVKCVAGNLALADGRRFEYSVLHEMPPCEKFMALEPTDFLAAVNDATLGTQETARLRRERGDA